MKLSMAHLLIHSDSVPREALQVLLAASSAPPEGRSAHLESAARILSRELDLDCRDARDLLGLPAGGDCR